LSFITENTEKLAPGYQDIHREIIELSKGGDRNAQYQLYRLYSKAMFSICMRMLNNREEAEDLLQDSFCDAYMRLDTFRYECSFGTWLKRIVINKCINRIQKRKIQLVFPEELEERSGMTDHTMDYEDTNYEDIQLEVMRIHRAIEQLPDGYRIIFSLYALEGYDHSEIASITGISESTSKSQYLRAKERIREILKSDGHEKRQTGTVHS
jgi:RNA polymerase sigma-70 factor (ECF subfamily)